MSSGADLLAQALRTVDQTEADRLAVAAILAEPDLAEAYALRGDLAARRGDAVTAAHHFRVAYVRGDRRPEVRAALATCLEAVGERDAAISMAEDATLSPELETFAELTRMMSPAIRGMLALPLPEPGMPALLPGERRPVGPSARVTGPEAADEVPIRASGPITGAPPRPFGMANPPNRPSGVIAGGGASSLPPARPTGVIPGSVPPTAAGGLSAAPPARPSGVITSGPPSRPSGVITSGPPSRPTGVIAGVPAARPSGVITSGPPSRPSGVVALDESQPPASIPPSRPSGVLFAPSVAPGAQLDDPGRPASSPPQPMGGIRTLHHTPIELDLGPDEPAEDWLEPHHTLRAPVGRSMPRESWLDDDRVMMQPGEDGARIRPERLELVVDPGVPDGGFQSPVTGQMVGREEVERDFEGAQMPDLNDDWQRRPRPATASQVRTHSGIRAPLRSGLDTGAPSVVARRAGDSAGPQPALAEREAERDSSIRFQNSSRPAPAGEVAASLPGGAIFRTSRGAPGVRAERTSLPPRTPSAPPRSQPPPAYPPEPVRPIGHDPMEARAAFASTADNVRLALELPGPVITAAGVRPQQLCIRVALGLTAEEILLRDLQRPDLPLVRLGLSSLRRLDLVREGVQLSFSLSDGRQLHLDLRELAGRAPILARMLVAELSAALATFGIAVVG